MNKKINLQTIRYFTVFLVICSLLLTSCELNQQGLEAGKQSFLEQNYREAYLRLKPLADEGNSDAQYAVGYMFYYGQGVVEDKDSALHYIKLAAEQGNHAAQHALQLLFTAEDNKKVGPETLEGNKPL